MVWIAFGIGIFVGVFLGIFAIGLCRMTGKADDCTFEQSCDPGEGA